jgi:hypothetical protein
MNQAGRTICLFLEPNDREEIVANENGNPVQGKGPKGFGQSGKMLKPIRDQRFKSGSFSFREVAA